MIIDQEFAELIPALEDEEFEGLERSILAEGCRDALVVWNDTLIDGHNRYKICTKHNIPFKTIKKDFKDRNAALLWIIDNQLSRRNLPKYVSTVLALKREPIYAAMAKENQRLWTGSQKSENLSKDTLIDEYKGIKPIDRYKEIAKAAGVSHDTVAKVKKIEAVASPEIKKQLRDSEISINQAYQQIRQQEKKQEVQQRIAEYVSVQTGTVDITKTDKKYNIVYADPAWQYWEGGNKNQSLHYTTMTIDEICELPVKNITADDCALFLWVTYPILPDAFKVIEAWGFKYSTAAFVWIKKNKSSEDITNVIDWNEE